MRNAKCKNAKRAHMQTVTKQNLLTILYIGCKHIICKAKMQKRCKFRCTVNIQNIAFLPFLCDVHFILSNNTRSAI